MTYADTGVEGDAESRGRTSQVETPSKRAPAAGDRANEVGLVAPPTRARCLGRASGHLLLLHLHDWGEPRNICALCERGRGGDHGG